MLSKLAHLTLCHSIQLLVLLARSKAARTWRSWCSATNWPCCAGRSHAPGSSPPTAPCSRRSAGHCRAPAVVLLRQPRHAAALAPAAGRRRLDPPAPPARATTTRPGTAAADRPPGQREPPLGLPAHPGRTSTAWRGRLGDRDPHHAAPPRPGPLLHRRHRLAATALHPVLHRTRHPPGPPGRGDRQPQRRLVTQQARNLLLRLEDQGRRVRFRIRDHDAKFCRGSTTCSARRAPRCWPHPCRRPTPTPTPARSGGCGPSAPSALTGCCSSAAVTSGRSSGSTPSTTTRHPPHRAVAWPSSSWIVRVTGRLVAVAGRWNGGCGTASSSSRAAT